jgi:hypothetical protein
MTESDAAETPQTRPFVVWDLATGEIAKCGGASLADWANQAKDGQGILEAIADRRRFYVVDGAIVERPALGLDKTTIFADGADEAVAAAPAGTRVHVKRKADVLGERSWAEYFRGEIAEGEAFHLTAIEAGTYQLRLVPPFPWQVLDAEIEARL